MVNEKIFVTKSSMPPYEEYIEAIKPLWESHWLTNMGKYHKQLEKGLKEYLDVPGLSLMVNGHMALELAIQSFGFPEGSEVITTPFTFISTTHAIVRNRLQPVFCDVKESDGTIDETKIEELITPKTVAILPVHVYGHVCNVKEIQKIADNYNLKVIYDAAHAFGERYLNDGIGNYGDVSVFSFHATKVYNTIEGGAVVCKDEDKFRRLRDLKNFGIRGEELVVSVGANAKMNEFSAIMGICNLKYIDKVVENRKKVYDFYLGELEEVKWLELYSRNENATNNYGYFPIKIKDNAPLSRDDLCKKYQTHDIYPRKYFYPLTADQACFKNKYKDKKIDVARRLSRQTMILPLYDLLEPEKQKEIIEIITTERKQ